MNLDFFLTTKHKLLCPLFRSKTTQIATWLQEYHSYDKIIGFAREQFGVEIPRMTLSRYRSRLALLEYLDDTPESTAAAAEFIQFAATAQDNFSRATLHILERTAFELALTCRIVDEDMDALKAISTILCRHRNTSVRERLAAVQEEKCKLRHHELNLKAARRGLPVPSEPVQDDGVTEAGPALVPGPALAGLAGHSPSPVPAGPSSAASINACDPARSAGSHSVQLLPQPAPLSEAA